MPEHVDKQSFSSQQDKLAVVLQANNTSSFILRRQKKKSEQSLFLYNLSKILIYFTVQWYCRRQRNATKRLTKQIALRISNWVDWSSTFWHQWVCWYNVHLGALICVALPTYVLQCVTDTVYSTRQTASEENNHNSVIYSNLSTCRMERNPKLQRIRNAPSSITDDEEHLHDTSLFIA